MEKYYTMSQKELIRLEVFQKVARGEITQVVAGQLLNLGKRQVIRLYQQYKRLGAKGLISRRRGQPSNHRLSDELKQDVLSLIRTHYPDFGPTLAQEKLTEVHGLKISVESTRQLMIGAGLWQGQSRKRVTVHPLRERRSAFGELIQLDGSPHAWFEERGPTCCLLVLIDDATSRIVGLRFEPTETTRGYFRLLRQYFHQYGLPVCFYSDKNSIFRINAREREPLGGEGQTQFARAMQVLGIELICANSPQAKGRVEKANRTLQDRLVKELRLQGISDLDQGNDYLPTFIEDYNRRFAVAPKLSVDVHRQEKPSEKALKLIFDFHHTRTLSKNLELSFNNQIYQVKTEGQGYTLRHAKVTVCVDEDETVNLLYKGKYLPYQVYEKRAKTVKVVDSKTLNQTVNKVIKNQSASSRSPKKDHPWRQYELVAAKKARAASQGTRLPTGSTSLAGE